MGLPRKRKKVMTFPKMLTSTVGLDTLGHYSVVVFSLQSSVIHLSLVANLSFVSF